MKNYRTETQLIHGDASDDDFSLSPPITYSSAFHAESAEMFAEMATEPIHPKYYTRYGNPLHHRVTKILAAIEGAEAGVVAASGMGAISSTILGLLKKGDHVVAQASHYMATAKIMTELLPRYGVEVTLVDQTSTVAFETAVKDNTRLMFVETPANPLLTITNLAEVAAVAKKNQILTVCDNTFASPINQNPIALGIDIVVHSATKFLGGHHDLVAGVVVSRKELIEEIWETLIVLGPTLSPMDAWLLLRGLRTLSLRVERQNETAMKVAKFLEGHSRIDKVLYPGLESHPQHQLAKKQMKGFGGLISFLFRGSYSETARFVSQLNLPKNAVSLGGVETLLVHAAAMWAGTMTEEQMQAAKISPNLVRISVGLENGDDLIQDLDVALRS